MKIIIAPDKFKGSLSSREVGEALRKGIICEEPDAEILLFPISDGGDGFAEVLKFYLQTTTKRVVSVDPVGRPIHSEYEWNEEQKIAIIELAACSGLAMLETGKRDPMKTSTYGSGIQLQHAISDGAKKIMLGLGGSATNDGGTGILAALGFIFLNERDEKIIPCGGNLIQIKTIIPPSIVPEIKIEISCDVTNPLFGPKGAAHIFAPQKGAGPADVELLDQGLKNFASILEKSTGKQVAAIAGTGAGGGVAAGLIPYFDTSLVKGIDLVMQASNIRSFINDADLIVTGEGKIDLQSFDGKAVSAIALLANENNIPCYGICGKLELSAAHCKQMGLAYTCEIAGEEQAVSIRMIRAAEFVEQSAHQLLQVFRNHDLPRSA